MQHAKDDDARRAALGLEPAETSSESGLQRIRDVEPGEVVARDERPSRVPLEIAGRGGTHAPEQSKVQKHVERAKASLATRTGKAILVVVVLLVIARLLAPYAIKSFLNKKLSELEGYSGHVDDVGLALWRGAYHIGGLTIEKTEGRVPVPFVSARDIDISVQWMALFQGSVVAEINVEHPIINFVKAGGGSAEQTGEEADWRSFVDDIVPININYFSVRDGQVHYRDFGSEPQVDLRLDRIAIDARNLSTVQDQDRTLPSQIHLSARAQRTGNLSVDVDLDPWNEQPTFDLALRLRSLDVKSLNEFLRAYAGVDAEAGELFVYSQLRARDGSFRGYVKPMVQGLSIYRPDEEGDPIDLIGDALVGLVAEVFENHGTDRFSVQVPMSGTFESPGVDGWTAFTSILYNTFIHAIEHGLENPGDWRRAQDESNER